jgi:hypothetical protein
VLLGAAGVPDDQHDGGRDGEPGQRGSGEDGDGDGGVQHSERRVSGGLGYGREDDDADDDGDGQASAAAVGGFGAAGRLAHGSALLGCPAWGVGADELPQVRGVAGMRGDPCLGAVLIQRRQLRPITSLRSESCG